MIGSWENWAGWVLGIVFVLLCFLAFIGRKRYINFTQVEKLHHLLGKQLGVQVAYLNARSFTLFGSYRDYTIHIEPLVISSEESKALYGVKCFVPMVNPNRKALRIRHQGSEHTKMSHIATIDHPVQMNNVMGKEIEILTNDLLFSGLILSDDVKISLYEVFQMAQDGLLYLHDDELAFLSPALITTPENMEIWPKIIDLLCDMKDELQF